MQACGIFYSLCHHYIVVGPSVEPQVKDNTEEKAMHTIKLQSEQKLKPYTLETTYLAAKIKMKTTDSANKLKNLMTSRFSKSFSSIQ